MPLMRFECLVAESVGGGLLPGGAGGDVVPPLLDVGVTVQSSLEALALEQIGSVGEEGEISEGEVATSEVLGLRELVLEDVKEAVQLLLQGRDLGLVGLLSVESGSKEELNNNVGDGARVGLLKSGHVFLIRSGLSK